MLDAGNRQRDALPSIIHLDLDKIKSDKGERQRFPRMGLNTSTGPLGSPSTIYSGPLPPYSCAPSTTSSVHGLSGYISPPESNSRRSVKDEKDSPSAVKSLPSISEALKNTEMPLPGQLSTNQSHGHVSAPSTSIGQSFPDAPRGPPNPFSQSNVPASSLRDSFSSASGPPEPLSSKPVPPPLAPTEPRQATSQSYGYPSSPRTSAPSAQRPSASAFPPMNSHTEGPPIRSPYPVETPRQGYTFSEYQSQQPPVQSHASNSFHFESSRTFEDQRNHFAKNNNTAPYGETVKRHLDVFDAEMALNEVGEASARTLDFSKIWTQRYHQSNRNGYYPDSLPGLHEIDDMMRQSHRVMDGLDRIREVVSMQQTALSEQRARAARGSLVEDEYHGLPDEYKAGGFAGGDSKKRRGKAAPPGRCHSCNRAETPEWRRGPDGARTLCNACGLHYAKLTRKMGANKAAVLTGSNLRPKTLDPRSPHS